jgi:hypothetical protein
MFIYLFLCVLLFLLFSTLTSREYLTLQDVDLDNKKLMKRIGTLETEYTAIQQKLSSQQSVMKSASDQAAAAKASISAARAS